MSGRDELPTRSGVPLAAGTDFVGAADAWGDDERLGVDWTHRRRWRDRDLYWLGNVVDGR